MISIPDTRNVERFPRSGASSAQNVTMHTLSKTFRPKAVMVRVRHDCSLIFPLVFLTFLFPNATAQNSESLPKQEIPANGDSKKEQSTSSAAPKQKRAEPPQESVPVPAEPSPAPAPDMIGPPLPPVPQLVPDILALPDPTINPVGDIVRRRERVPPVQFANEESETPETQPEAKPVTFIVPGFYGQAPTQYTTGEGRLALPRFRTSISLGLGYDDNPQTSSGSVDGESEGSAFATAQLSSSYQMGRKTQILIWDGRIGTDVYAKDIDPSYELALGLTYQRQFARVFALTANVGVSYSNQPDYGQKDFVRGTKEEQAEDERSGDSSFLSAHAKIDLSAQWRPRFSTVTSLGGELSLYGGAREQDNGASITIGNEFRYRVDRYTLVGEVRYETTSHKNGGLPDADTVYVLGGVDWHLGRWVFVTTRFGESIRSYSGGGSSVDPLAELGINFNPTVQDSFSLSARYGLETNAVGEGDSATFRVGLGYTRLFTSRLSGSLTLNYTDSGGTVSASSGQNSFSGERIIDAALSLNYRLSSRLVISGSVACTRGSGGDSSDASNPDRNRVEINAVYQF